MADTDFKIKITTTADTAGAQSAASALQGLGKAAGETGKESKSLGEELGKLGARNSEAKDVIEGLETASRGGASGLFGLAKAGRNLWEVFAGSTVIGRVVQLTALAAAGFLALREKITEVEKPAEDVTKTLDEAVAAAAKINQVRLEALKTELDAISNRAKVASDAIDGIYSATDKLSKARMGVELATLAADSSLSPEEKAKREYEIRKKYGDEAAKNEQQKAEEQVANAAQKAKELRETADREYFAERKKAEEALARTIENRSGLNTAVKVLTEFATGELKKNDPLDTEANSRVMAWYNPLLARLKDRQDAAFNPAADSRLKILRDRAETAGTGQTSASLAADKAEEELRLLREKTNLSGYVNSQVRANEDKAARITAGLPDRFSAAPSSLTTISEPTRMTVGGQDYLAKTEAINQRMAALANAEKQLAAALQTLGTALEGREGTIAELQAQVRALRR